MSSKQPVSAEVMQLMARHARIRRLTIVFFSLLFIAAFSMGAWVVWKRSNTPDTAPPGGLTITTTQRSEPQVDQAFQPTAAQPAPATAPAEPQSLFDVTPGLGNFEHEAEIASAAPTESTLRTGAVLEQLASEREMQQIDFESFDANTESARAMVTLNGLLEAADPAGTTDRLRHGELMLPALESFAGRPEAGRLPERLTPRSAGLQMVENLPILLVQVSHPHFREAAFLLDTDTEDWLLDWESFVGYSQLGWDELREQRPTETVFVRAYATLSDYYNFEFASPSELVSVRLDSPDNFHAIYAYVERRTELAQEVATSLARGRVRPILAEIRYPDNARHDNQVFLDDVVAWRWLDTRDHPTTVVNGNGRRTTGPAETPPPADDPSDPSDDEASPSPDESAPDEPAAEQAPAPDQPDPS